MAAYREEVKNRPPEELNPGWVLLSFMAATLAILHFVRPNVDFGDNTSVFLWPFSPINVAVPFAIGYTLWLWKLINQIYAEHISPPRLSGHTVSPRHYHIIATGLICAITLSVDVLVILIKGPGMEVYESLPAYEFGNLEAESTWFLTALGVVFAFFCASFFVLTPIWWPVLDIWETAWRINRFNRRSAPSSFTANIDSDGDSSSNFRAPVGELPSMHGRDSYTMPTIPTTTSDHITEEELTPHNLVVDDDWTIVESEGRNPQTVQYLSQKLRQRYRPFTN